MRLISENGDIQPEILSELLVKKLLVGAWKLHMPSVLISITGGAAKDFKISEELKQHLNLGLVQAVQPTSAWVITGGTEAGVMKLTGRALREVDAVVEQYRKVLDDMEEEWRHR